MIMNARKTTAAHTASRKATPLHAYVVKDGKGESRKGFWTRIGTAWPHEDGEGFNILLDALPVDGRIVLRAPKADEQEG
jgi:hypothetical protein